MIQFRSQLRGSTSQGFTGKPFRRPVLAYLPEPRFEGYSPEHLCIAGQAWPMKAAEELRSAAVMAEAQRLAIRNGLPRVMVAALSQMAQDELVHADLCLGVSQHFGIDRVPVSMDRIRSRFASLPDDRLRFLALVTIELAIGETLSTGLFLVAARSAKEPLQQAVLRTIVKDEAIHARTGWKFLEALQAEMSGSERNFLREEVRAQLAILEQTMAVPALKRLEARVEFHRQLARLGVIAPETRVEVFYRTLETRVLPSLDANGLEGTRGWRNRYRPTIAV